jgi:hypothetical protein
VSIPDFSVVGLNDAGDALLVMVLGELHELRGPKIQEWLDEVSADCVAQCEQYFGESTRNTQEKA